MIIGLILACRSLRTSLSAILSPVCYLRTNLWDEPRFSDKNKISSSSAVSLEWNSDTLLDLINERIKVKMGPSYDWSKIEDGLLMRGSQPKWNHIIARTFNRPRDVIQFLNFALTKAVKELPDADLFDNTGIQAAREPYSRYLKQELDDEIGPHWPQWGEALQACSELRTLTFTRDEFGRAYARRKSIANLGSIPLPYVTAWAI